MEPAKCYLLPKGVDRLNPFLTVLEELVKGGPSLFAAVVTLNLLEVSPRSTHVPFLVGAAKTWLESYADDSDFWVDHRFRANPYHYYKPLYAGPPRLIDFYGPPLLVARHADVAAVWSDPERFSSEPALGPRPGGCARAWGRWSIPSPAGFWTGLPKMASHSR
jgi:hypothetical protein